MWHLDKTRYEEIYRWESSHCESSDLRLKIVGLKRFHGTNDHPPRNNNIWEYQPINPDLNILYVEFYGLNMTERTT